MWSFLYHWDMVISVPMGCGHFCWSWSFLLGCGHFCTNGMWSFLLVVVVLYLDVVEVVSVPGCGR